MFKPSALKWYVLFQRWSSLWVLLIFLVSCRTTLLQEAPPRTLYSLESAELLALVDCAKGVDLRLQDSVWQDIYFRDDSPFYLDLTQEEENQFLYHGFFGTFEGRFCNDLLEQNLYITYSYKRQNFLSAYHYSFAQENGLTFLELRRTDSNDPFGYFPTRLLFNLREEHR